MGFRGGNTACGIGMRDQHDVTACGIGMMLRQAGSIPVAMRDRHDVRKANGKGTSQGVKRVGAAVSDEMLSHGGTVNVWGSHCV
eukprot:gene14188-biopygen3860